MFLIIHQGRCTPCNSVPALSKSIQNYRGKSVTIEDLRLNGRDYLVDVLEDGLIYESRGARARFDIELRLG